MIPLMMYWTIIGKKRSKREVKQKKGLECGTHVKIPVVNNVLLTCTFSETSISCFELIQRYWDSDSQTRRVQLHSTIEVNSRALCRGARRGKTKKKEQKASIILHP